MDKIKKSIRKDEQFKRFRRIVANSQHLELEGLVKEVESMHASRSIRAMKGGDVGNRTIVKAASEDQSYRSRLVEIMMQLKKEYSPLRMAIEATRDYLNSHYGKDIGLRSIADRDAFWRSLMRKAVNRAQVLEDTIEFAELVIEDIDKASFTIKHLIEVLTLTTQREYTQ